MRIIRTLCAFLFAAASPAIGPATFAATYTIRGGGDLTAREWPDGTVLNLADSDGVLLADRPVAWRGHLTINGNDQAISFRQNKDGAALFTTSDTRKLSLFNLQIIANEFPGGMTRAIEIDGRAHTLRNVFVAGGDTIILRRGHLTWIGGGTGDQTPKKYGAGYFGDVLSPGDTAGTFYLENLAIRSGRGETGLRIMGASGKIVNCSFDGRSNNYHKESIQVRHGNERDEPIEFINCRFVNNGVAGPLGKGGATESMLRVYHEYAKRHPARILFDGGSMIGYATVEGSAIVDFKTFAFVAKDRWDTKPYSIAPSYAVGARVHWMPYGTFRPVVTLRGCKAGSEWERIAGPGVTVKP